MRLIEELMFELRRNLSSLGDCGSEFSDSKGKETVINSKEKNC